MQTVSVSPEQMVNGAESVSKPLSPEAADIVNRLKDHYRQAGKASAATNYSRHLRAFFAWAESNGHSVKSLPSDSVEAFLGALAANGQKETTVYVMRTQLKSALKEAHQSLGVDFAHLEYQTGKPREVRQHQKAKEKEKRQAAKAQTILAQAQAIQAAQAVYGTQQPAPTHMGEFMSAPAVLPPDESPINEPSAPVASGGPTVGVAAGGQQPYPVIVNMPAPAPAAPQRPLSTIGNAGQKAAAPAAPQAARGVVLNNHTFTGAFVKISRIADGSEAFTPPGTETFITTLPASQLAAHGDVAAFLQSYIVKGLRLPPTVSQVHFVFHELNDRRQPTGRRDEMVVSVMSEQGAAPQQFNGGLAGLPTGGLSDPTTNYLLRKLDDEAAEAKKRAEALQEQLRDAKDSQTTFMLMQSFQKEQDLRKELEGKREREAARIATPPPPPPQPFGGFGGAPFMPPMPLFDPPKADTSLADAMRAMSEQNAKTLEVLATALRPQPVAPQKDTSEWLVPFMAQMNQQAQAQAQQQQQMMLTLMQSQATQQQAQMAAQQQQSQQFMQLLIGKESSVEKMLVAQLQEAKAQANAPKGDDIEDLAEKLQKYKMVSEMMGGGGSGASILTELLQNADTIGAGAAKVIEAAQGKGGAMGAPTKQIVQQQQQLAGAPAPAQLPAGQQVNAEPPAPPESVLAAHKAFADAVEERDEQKVAQTFVLFVKELATAQQPFAAMGARILTAFQQAEDEGELYTLAKNLWIVVGQKALRPQAKYTARVLAGFYESLHEAMYGEPGSLAEDEYGDDEEEGEEDGEGLPESVEA